MNYEYDEVNERLVSRVNIAPELDLLLVAGEIHKNHLGIRATVSIGINTTLLDKDTITIGNAEARNKLANAALKTRSAQPVKTALEDADLQHELLMFTDGLWAEWVKKSRIHGEEHGDASPSAPLWAVPGLILEGATGIGFGNAKSGKSTFMRVLAQSIRYGIADIVPVRRQSPVVWVNAEEPPSEHRRQFGNVNAALGIERTAGVYTVDARGLGFKDVSDRVKAAVDQTGAGFVFVDSLSRLAQGENLNDNATATLLMDSLSGLPAAVTWIGHTGQENQHRLAGSRHFLNAARVMFRVQGRISRVGMNPELTRGLRVSVTDANGAAPVAPSYWTLRYHRDYGLASIVPADEDEWPTLHCTAEYETRGETRECGRKTWDGVLPNGSVRCPMHRDEEV